MLCLVEKKLVNHIKLKLNNIAETFDPTITPNEEIYGEFESIRDELKLAIKAKN